MITTGARYINGLKISIANGINSNKLFGSIEAIGFEGAGAEATRTCSWITS